MVAKILIVVIGTFAVSVFAVRQLCKPTSRFYISDIPNERSLHANPTPRNGGLGVLLAIGLGYAATIACGFFLSEYMFVGIMALGLAFTGYLDDRFNLKSSLRFAIHFSIAAITTFSMGPLASLTLPFIEIPMGTAAIPFTILFIVWMINLYNFMDGMDGFAGGMTLFGFSMLAILFQLQGAGQNAILALIPAIAAGGFLIFNFPPARIFLGDTGSTVLGYLAAVFMLTGQNEGLVPLWVSVMTFSPFILDATATLIYRIWKKERFWEAHRSHFYQRLVLSGLSHQSVLLIEYASMMWVAMLAAASLMLPNFSMVLFVTWIASQIALGFTINAVIKKRAR